MAGGAFGQGLLLRRAEGLRGVGCRLSTSLMSSQGASAKDHLGKLSSNERGGAAVGCDGVSLLRAPGGGGGLECCGPRALKCGQGSWGAR